MEAEKIFEKEVFAEGRSFVVEYYLTEEEICPDGGFGMCMYGIEVVKTENSSAESAYAGLLSTDKREVRALIGVISRALVTPSTLFDVVYDWTPNGRNEEEFGEKCSVSGQRRRCEKRII